MAQRTSETAPSKQVAQEKIRENMKKISHKLLVISGKGGVGKTTVAANLAFSLVLQDKKVGLLDVDIHGPNIAKMVGAEGKKLGSLPDGKIEPIFVPPGVRVVSISPLLKNIDTPVIWRGPLKMKLITQFLSDVDWQDLDYLIIDSPPGTGDEPLSVAQLIPDLTGAIIVTTPQEVALLDSRKAVNFARAVNIPIIGVIENMSGLTCPHCGKQISLFKKGGGEKAARELNVPFLGRLPLDPDIVTSGDKGKPFVIAGERDQRGPGSGYMNKIIISILEVIGGKAKR